MGAELPILGGCCQHSGPSPARPRPPLWAAVAAIGAILGILAGAPSIHTPSLRAGMSYGLALLTGLVTGTHCVAMCGGFVLSYTASGPPRRSLIGRHVRYAVGKTLSYATVGGILGLFGTASMVTPTVRGLAGAGAGGMLIALGIGRHALPAWIARVVPAAPVCGSTRTGRGPRPFALGLVNGLMVTCGPLQAMYLVAAETGSPVEGAALMFVFGVGTLPVMLGLGLAVGTLGRAARRRAASIVGSLVVAMGVLLLNDGLTVMGTGFDARSLAIRAGLTHPPQVARAGPESQTIEMIATRDRWIPDRFVLRAGVPVRWIIRGEGISRCTERVEVPALGLSIPLERGTTVVEFTPTEPGLIPWSCWMGMIPGTFLVEGDGSRPPSRPVAAGPGNPTPGAASESVDGATTRSPHGRPRSGWSPTPRHGKTDGAGRPFGRRGVGSAHDGSSLPAVRERPGRGAWASSTIASNTSWRPGLGRIPGNRTESSCTCYSWGWSARRSSRSATASR